MVEFSQKENYGLYDFVEIIRLLRSENGCPWDKVQTHESIRRNLLEEAYEACEAIDEQDTPHLREELGDVLMQVIFHASIEEDKGNFTLEDVADAACKKLIYRHPHVFGTTVVSGTEEVLHNWDELKKKERAQTDTADTMASVSKTLPALWRAEKVQKTAAGAGFDWPDIHGAMDKLREEVGELEEAVQAGDGAHVREELGDVLFAAVKAARFAGVDPEDALHAACEKFIARFRGMETLAKAQGQRFETLPLEAQAELYRLVKAEATV